MRPFLRLFTESLQFKYYFSPYFASAGFKEEMGAQKARPAAKKAPGVRAVPVKQKKLKVPIFGESSVSADPSQMRQFSFAEIFVDHQLPELFVIYRHILFSFCVAVFCFTFFSISRPF